MKQVFTIFILISTLITYSQNREDDKLPIISKDIIGQISSANGWKKNQYGKWVTNKNKIPYDIEQQYKSLINYEVYALGDNRQNFISYQLYDIKIKDSIYSLLVEKYRDGFYRYESISEGWQNSNSYKYYVFNKKDLEELKKTNDDSIHSFEIKLLYGDDKKYTDLTKINSTTLSKEVNSAIAGNSLFGIKKVYITIRKFKAKKIIQFFISEYYYDFNENMYYETDYLNFSKFLKLE